MTILFLLLFLWLLAGITLLLHILHSRMGLTPLMMYLGAMAATMQVQGLRAIEISYQNHLFSIDGAVLLPVLLFGILIVYVTNGSVRGRSAALGIILISILIISFQALLFFLPQIVNIEYTFLQTYSLRVIFASMLTLGVDIIVLFLGYQILSNLRHRYPSRFASGLALILALFIDAIIFSSLAFGGSSNQAIIFQSQIIQKMVAGLALWPLLAVYISKIVPRFPDSAARSPRPVLDIFTTNLQLELRARYHYSLLRTLSQINQLIVRATDPDLLLEKTCNALVELRDYHLVWIGTFGRQDTQITKIAQAGFSREQVKNFIDSGQMRSLHRIRKKDKASVVNNIEQESNLSSDWKSMMLSTGCRAAATFPMRYAEQTLGILNVCLERPNSFGEIEIDLLQELADDLAYALISLEARSQQALLHTSASTMRDGLLILNTQGEITYVNQVISQLFAVPPNDLIGQHVRSILSQEQAKTLESAYNTLLQESVLVFDIDYQPEGRKALVLSINASLGRNENGEPVHIVINIHDVTAQRKYEHQLLTLHRLTTDLVQIHDPQILSNMILKISQDVLEGHASGIYILDPKTKKVIETLTRNLPNEYSQRIARDYRGLPGEDVLKTLQPISVSDTLNNDVYGDRIHFMADYGIRALLLLPVLSQENVTGALTIYYPRPHKFTASEMQLGLTLAHTLAIVYQNAQLYQAEHTQRELAEALALAASSINSSLELGQVLDQLLEQVMRVIECRAANILMIENETGYFHSHRGYDDMPEYLQFVKTTKMQLTTPNLATMLSTGEPCLITDTSHTPDWVPLKGAEWIKSYAAIPLKVDQQVVGFLNVDSDKVAFFSDETLKYLASFADYAATAIQNARLYEAELKQREFAEALVQAAAVVSSSLELEDVLDHILEQAMRVVPCQAANIMLIEKKKVILARHRGYEKYVDDLSSLITMEFPISWPGLMEMYTEEKPTFIADTAQSPDWQSAPYAKWIRSFIGIPLKVDQQVVGFLNIDSDTPNHLQPEFVPQLQSFADYASTAIKNARAYENSRLRAEEMAALVAAASAVSKNLDYIQALHIVAEQMTKTLHIQACAISAYDSATNSLTYLIGYGTQKWNMRTRWQKLESLDDYPVTQGVLKNNEPFQIQSSDPNLNPIQREFLKDAGANTLLMLPLITQERTIGLIILIDSEKDRVFSPREIALGFSVASHAATAMENARLYQQLQVHASYLEERVQQRTKELQEATDYIEGILASVPDAVFVLDQDNLLVRANQAGERLLAQAQIAGLELFNPKLLKILENGGGPYLQSILEIEERAYQAISSRLVTNDDQPGGQIIVFRDVTQFRELDQMKTQFVSDVSHELRTPLTNLTLYLGLLTTVRDAQKQSNYILTMQRETERLTHLIEDLLTISRLEAQRIQFQIRAIDINQLVDNLVRDRAFLAAQKNITLEFTPAANLPLGSIDENMLTQALSNLLTNAINYTLPGGSINVYSAQPESDWVTIEIADTGVGIPPEEIDQIFDRFYRGGASQKTGAEGTGLGLAISEEIIHRLNGKITLLSTPGEGSTFTIWLRPASDDML